jgi:hypothetical protein
MIQEKSDGKRAAKVILMPDENAPAEAPKPVKISRVRQKVAAQPDTSCIKY